MLKIITTKETAELVKLRKKLSIKEGLVTGKSSALTKAVFGKPLTPLQVVQKIIEDVREKGDQAVAGYAKKLDGYIMRSSDFYIRNSEIKAAYKQTGMEYVRAIRHAAFNIRTYQTAIRYKKVSPVRQKGLTLDLRVVPLDRVGVYIPAGTAPLASTVLMTALPARVAGVREIILSTPPGKNGSIDPHILVAADICGVDRIVRAGGVQALAAMALGTDKIPKADKITGPGNIFVTLAKKELYGEVDIDMLAGPSEVIVLADDSADPLFVAYDILAQAEHSPGSSVLVTPSRKLAEQVNQKIKDNLNSLERKDLLKEDLSKYCMAVIVKNMKEGIDLVNQFAPEHLQLSVRKGSSVMKSIKNAGAVFVGNYTPVALGDYWAGPSHTLPTGGTAAYFSGVNVNDFLKTFAVIKSSKTYLKENAREISLLAEREGLTAHRDSVMKRVKEKKLKR